MANKPVQAKIKLQVPGGEANPQPPVGPALGQHGVNLMEFINQFNERTKDKKGWIIPVEISVYKDRSFDFITKSPPASSLLKRAADIANGSGVPNRDKVGKVTRDLVEGIAKEKMEDLNAASIESAMRIIEGTARSMGVTVEGA